MGMMLLEELVDVLKVVSDYGQRVETEGCEELAGHI